MVDVTGFSTILTSIKTATDIAKLIKDSGVSLEQAEIKLKLAELVSALADAKIDIATIQQTLIEKDLQIQEMRKELSVRERVEYRDPSYWLKCESGEEGPYCQRCYDAEGKLIRLQGGEDGAWACRACKTAYYEPARRMRDEVALKTPLPRRTLY